MKTCTFFGHRDCPSDIRASLREAILSMIREHGVDTFYVGHQGAFDRMAAAVLESLTEEFPTIRYFVVLAYMPVGKAEEPSRQTLFPEGQELVPRRFAIVRRNEWLLKRCDYVIAYVVHHCGNAHVYVEKAERKGIPVIYVQ